MCGIVGVHGWGDPDVLHRMTDLQEHRGPDDVGTWDVRLPDGGYLGLGNRRLSIIDLSFAGHMPMGNEEGTVWITYNGELYLTSTYRHAADFPGNRSWNHDVVRDPHVRLKIGDRIYERQLFLVTDPAEKTAVLDSKAKKYPDLRRAEEDRVHVLRTEPW